IAHVCAGHRDAGGAESHVVEVHDLTGYDQIAAAASGIEGHVVAVSRYPGKRRSAESGARKRAGYGAVERDSVAGDADIRIAAGCAARCAGAPGCGLPDVAGCDCVGGGVAAGNTENAAGSGSAVRTATGAALTAQSNRAGIATDARSAARIWTATAA